MKISVFTPLYHAGNQYIQATYETLCQQTHSDWEWIVLLNNGGQVSVAILEDARVCVIDAETNNGHVGALKREACSYCDGEVLFELDHDDLLHCQALERVTQAVTDGADFVYSDFAEFKSETWEPNAYAEAYGWKRYGAEFQGHPLIAMRAPECTPQNLRSIQWAPNHLRAWRRSFYESLGGLGYGDVAEVFTGGHDPSLQFADDHDLVLRTYFSGGKITHVPECLYFYRVHGQQNVNVCNAKIQELDWKVYDRFIYKLAERFADESGLLKIDLCGGVDAPANYTPIDRNVDLEKRPDSIQADLDESWPLADSSVGVIRAFDAIEHLREQVHTMNEAWRVLAPGGFLLIKVPSTEGPGAWCDPTHVSFWNHLSFRYYTDRHFSRYAKEIKCRFQLARLVRTGGEIPYVVAELVALKDGFGPMGAVSI